MRLKSQSNTSATTTLLQNSEPSALPVSVESSKSDKSMEMGTKSVQPGAVADTAAPDAGFKGNKYQRKIAASTVNSKATGYQNNLGKQITGFKSSNDINSTCLQQRWEYRS